MLFVKLVEILAFTEQMRQTDLVVKKMQCEVCTVTVGHGSHAFERVTETVLKLLPFAAFAMEYQCEINCLRNPCPVKAFVSITTRLIKTDHGRLHYVFLDFLNGRSCRPFGFIYPVDHRALADFKTENLFEK